ncbi:MAG: DM13 domain-containing protein [Micromonosporaceae bacterium]
MRNLLRKPLTWVVLGVLAVGVVVGLWVFQPWKLFVDQTVNEALPSAAAPAESGEPAGARGPVLVAQGEFVTHEHDTSGTVKLIRNPDGKHQLAIEKLDTSNGPDLRVWLTDQEVKSGQDGWFVFDDGEYVELGALKGNKGSQVYEIPADVDVSKYRSVTIWCKRFSVSFGAAELTAA